MAPEDIVIARIVKVRGIAGEVVCDIETDFPERFESLHTVNVRMPDGTTRVLDAEDHWFFKSRVVFKFKGFDDRSAAQQLVGGLLVIDEAEVVDLPEDEFYEFQLLGSTVVTRTGRTLGRVARLIRTGATDVLVVGGEGKQEYLIPFTEAICGEVDREGKVITVDPPEGLLEL